MRILHTADWHLGHTLRDHSRDAEFEAFLAWLRQVLTSERVDALIVAGDIFDAAIPPPSAQAQWFGFLTDVWRALPGLHVVAIAGNHDHAHRLQASTPVLDALGRLHVVGIPDPARWVVELPEVGGPGAVCAVVPFLRPADLPVRMDPVAGVAAIYDRAFEQARQLRKPRQAMLATGHCYMVGGKISELSERQIQRGNQDALPVNMFPQDVTYVALGHLHLAQAVGSRANVRYAGSPLPLSVDEWRYPHAVTLVELESDAVRDIRQLPVPRAVEFMRVPAEGAAQLPEVVTALQSMPGTEGAGDGALWPVLDVHVREDQPNPALRKSVLDAAANRAVRVARVVVVRAGSGAALGDDIGDVAGLDDLNPVDVFGRKWRSAFPADPDQATVERFRHLLALAGDPKAADDDRAKRVLPQMPAHPTNASLAAMED